MYRICLGLKPNQRRGGRKRKRKKKKEEKKRKKGREGHQVYAE
jgi:hypothetical protein